mmetsp:Transcript_15099/g.17240  ORF Transcript_15099/g.17240 Transcript_15099/m.17240 type:complete len:86 (+) Transcript_15099:63-320(+)
MQASPISNSVNSTSTSNSTSNKPSPDGGNKLKNGPCSSMYNRLEQCAMSKNIDLRNHKKKLSSCPAQTDLLIKCMNKHPQYFYLS